QMLPRSGLAVSTSIAMKLLMPEYVLLRTDRYAGFATARAPAAEPLRAPPSCDARDLGDIYPAGEPGGTRRLTGASMVRWASRGPLPRPRHHDPVLPLDPLDPVRERALADLDRLADQRRVHEMELAVDPDREARMRDVQSSDAARGRDDVAVLDAGRDFRDAFLGDDVTRLRAEALLGRADRFEAGRVGELGVGPGVARHEVDRLVSRRAAELARDVLHDALALVVADPLAEVVEPAVIAVDHAAAVADARELALEGVEVVRASADHAGEGEDGLDVGDAVVLVQVDDEPLGAGDLEE